MEYKIKIITKRYWYPIRDLVFVKGKFILNIKLEVEYGK